MLSAGGSVALSASASAKMTPEVDLLYFHSIGCDLFHLSSLISLPSFHSTLTLSSSSSALMSEIRPADQQVDTEEGAFV